MRWFHVAIAVLTLVGAGCGRLSFDRQDGAAPDAAADVPIDEMPPDSCDPTAPFGAPVPIAELNTTDRDGTIRLLPDELSGYFWSFRTGVGLIYLATRPDLETPFSVTPVQGLAVPGNAMDPTLSADGTLLVFRNNGPGDDIWMATRTSPGTFASPVVITNVSSPSVDVQSAFRPGTDELYFMSSRSSGGDLYRSTRSGTTFTAPALVAELVTAAEEGDPAMSADGLTLFFRSNRAAALGGFNIFVATRLSTSAPFDAPTLVPGVNSEADDGPSDVSADGCRLYLSSDRAGSNDIFVATRGT